MNLVTIGTGYGKVNYQVIPVEQSYGKLIPELLLKDVLQLSPIQIHGLSTPDLSLSQVVIKYSSGISEHSTTIETKLPDALYKRCLEGKTSAGYLVSG